MWAGFALIFAAAVLGATNSGSATGKIIVGILGATGGAQAAYVARTFLRAQETAAEHLRAYFEQPLEFSRYLAAERLVDGLDVEVKTATLASIAIAIATHRQSGPSAALTPKSDVGTQNKEENTPATNS
jgi:hypothetical protein